MLQFPLDPHKKKSFFAMMMRLARESQDFNLLLDELREERTRIEASDRTCTDIAEIHQNHGALQVLYDIEEAIERAPLEVFGNKA